MGKDLKPDNLLLKLGNVETAIGIQDESRPVAPFQLGSCEPPDPATLSCSIRVYTPDDLLGLVRLSKLHIQLTDFGTGESSTW
jgi:hypothetical protein